MGRRKTTEEFIVDAKEVHGDKYDYSLAKYTNPTTPIKIICHAHGIFEQRPLNHFNLKQGCKHCGVITAKNKKIKKASDEFALRGGIRYKNKYDYSFVDYKTAKIEVKIICPIHGEFMQKPDKHLRRGGCRDCGITERSKKKTCKASLLFEKKSNQKHKNKYDYSFVDYKTAKIEVKIICPIHGEFMQTPDNHYNCGCNKCGEEVTAEKRTLSQKDFLIKANQAHNNKYDYSLVTYKKGRIKVKIICPIHGEFMQSAVKHMAGDGCPDCGRRRSIGSEKIEDYLSKKDISFEKECSVYIFKNNLFNIKRGGLKYDFFISTHSLFIEFDGAQHFRPVNFSGNMQKMIKAHKKSVDRDIIKNELAEMNNFKLIRIPYWEINNVDTILTKLFERKKLNQDILDRYTYDKNMEYYLKVQSEKTLKFISKVDNRHENFYDYSLVEYISDKDKVTIICPAHGEFEQSSNAHLAGKGCPKCG